jgi:hypothetical protein
VEGQAVTTEEEQDTLYRQAAMVVALYAIKQSVADIAAVVAGNAVKHSKSPPAKTDPDKAGAGKGNVFSNVFGLLGAKLGAVLGPLALFGQILQSNASGFQLVGTAVKVLAATLAPVLMPLFVSLAAALLDLQEDLEKRIMPAMKQWAKLIFNTLLPTLGKLVQMFMAVVDALAAFMTSLRGPERGDGRSAVGAAWDNTLHGRKNNLTAEQSNALNMISDLKAGRSEEDIKKGYAAQGDGTRAERRAIEDAYRVAHNAIVVENMRKGGTNDDDIMKHLAKAGLDKGGRNAAFATANAERDRLSGAAARPEAAPEAASTAAGMAATARAKARAEEDARAATPAGRLSGLEDVIRSLRISVGPKAQFSGLGEVTKNAQIAALNLDPVEMRMLRIMTREVELLEAAAADLRRMAGAAERPVFGERR